MGNTGDASIIAGVSGLENETFTKVGKLVLVDLAGNERLDETIQYFTESSAINLSLFFLGEVISKLSTKAILQDQMARNGGMTNGNLGDNLS